ncbi:MAG: cellulase family glycosylhydrolase [Ignavibacteriae bacterium]|nr:cellulase family glycosylhydrolase [Ignavibacteriota bacterium]
MSSRIQIQGSPVYLHGANYPWTINNGKDNYGLDFGANTFGTHSGVTTNRAQVEADFTLMEDLGFNTLRWFVFTDGRGGIRYDDNGVPVSVSEKFFDDFECALAIASRNKIRIIFVLTDFLWLRGSRAEMMMSAEGRQALLENIFAPLFERYSGNDVVLAWDVMNEPDWIINEMSAGANEKTMPLEEFKSFVKSVADAVHASSRQLVTVGNARLASVNVWDDDELHLDFLQVHSYNDMLRNPWDEILFGRNFTDLALKRPLVIGEFSTSAHLAFESKSSVEISLHEYLDFCRDSGYAGALYWSFNAVDKCGRESVDQLLRWKERITLT